MKKLLFILLLSFAGLAGMSQTTYYWVGGTGPVSFTVNSNWNTALNGSGATRSAAAATDILIIDGSNIGGATPAVGTVTATVTSTALSQLKLTGNANVVFLRPTGGGGTGTMTVGGNAPGDDFVIDAGSALSINAATADGSVVMALGTAATASISGNLTVGNTGQNRITNQTVGGMVFNSGATFTTNLTPASAAYAFGSSSQSIEKGVVFLSGSNIIYMGGFSPFGNNSTFSAIDMRPGSNWFHRATNLVTGQGSFSSGKAYGNIFVENSATYQSDGPIYRIGNLNIASGSTFITHTSGQVSVLGDLTVNGTYTVPATIGNVLVMGNTGNQTISGSGTLNAPSITIGDNSRTILNRNIAVATTLNVYGSINFNNFQVTGAGTFNSRVNNNAAALTGTLVAGSYQITAVGGTMGTINGLTVTGAGIPANTTVVGSSPANFTINLSQPITTAGTAVNLSFLNDTATLTTAHLNGMDTLLGSVVVTGTKTFSPGTNYIINAATTTPFGISTGSAGTTINAGFVDINAAVTANRSVYIDEHFGVNGKFSLRPLDTLRLLASAVINGTPGTTKYIATLSNAATGDRSLVQYVGLASSALIPVGSAANYLPVTLAPATASDFNVAVFEGITTNGTVNGTPLTPAQKLGVVNAVWNIERTAGTGSAGLQLGWQTALEGSLFITLPNSDIGVIYNNGTSYSAPLGTGDNTANTAAATVSTFGVFGVGSVPQTNPFIFNTLPPKTYGDPDFNTGVVSLNTTQPVTYTSSNTGVATVLPGNIVHITGAGTTDITASQASDGFYPAASITRTLTVSKAALTIKADTITKFFSQAVPPLTYTVTGFVLGETQAALLTPVTISTTGTAASPVGNYPIVINGATSNNYTITFIDAVLKVLAQSTQTITFNAPATKTYGNADFAANATSTNSTIPVTLTSSNPAVATIVGANIHIVGAGTANITASQAGNIGFSPAADVVRLLTVNKANLSIRVRDTLKMQGQPNPPYTLQVLSTANFVLGENFSNLLTQPVVTTSATITSAPGYYDLVLGGATSNNYNITYTNGRLTILPLSGTGEQYLNAFLISNSRLTVRVFSPSPKLANIVLYNIAGQPVAKKNLFMPTGFINSDLYVTGLPSGTYIVTVQGPGVDLKKTILIMKH
jgi:hypothetical protein